MHFCKAEVTALCMSLHPYLSVCECMLGGGVGRIRILFQRVEVVQVVVQVGSALHYER